MNLETPPTLLAHPWIPATGHALRHTGIHFDAIRVPGALGDQVAYELIQFADFEAGPIVREVTGGRNMYFLLRPGTAALHVWRGGARALGRDGRGVAFVGVPALEGNTWPLDWRSLPTREVPFVEGELLRQMVERVLTTVR
ncbi:hypothetical protein ABT390_20020 [Streptomyces aurantiacus]|uniref:DNA primase/polymerase bifunctional N-terminal domain-containing protein n=1 Tax=Streptomyces aurantiacus JA 4570 TaxID=1286094 RepID=S3ZSX3_9ACTN|nr:hypothetical protein [Streptomyces aurantiacus]EPH45894.1 hypothetical protein STRAU_1025 [Streptomyces aurantiacus JA 4570]